MNIILTQLVAFGCHGDSQGKLVLWCRIFSASVCIYLRTHPPTRSGWWCWGVISLRSYVRACSVYSRWNMDLAPQDKTIWKAIMSGVRIIIICQISIHVNLFVGIIQTCSHLMPAFFYFQRTDEEAVVDRGGTRSMLNTNFEKEELEGNSQMRWITTRIYAMNSKVSLQIYLAF